jgi:hypothetical protein
MVDIFETVKKVKKPEISKPIEEARKPMETRKLKEKYHCYVNYDDVYRVDVTNVCHVSNISENGDSSIFANVTLKKVDAVEQKYWKPRRTNPFARKIKMVEKTTKIFSSPNHIIGRYGPSSLAEMISNEIFPDGLKRITESAGRVLFEKVTDHYRGMAKRLSSE